MTVIRYIAAILTMSLLALPVSARSDDPPPVAPDSAPAAATAPNRFVLTGGDTAEIARLSRLHDLELCAADAPDGVPAKARRGYAIHIHWDKHDAVVLPGNCLTFDGMQVKARPAGRVPGGETLSGTLRVVR